MRVLVFDAVKGSLSHLSSFTAPSGSGPRHLASHPALPMLYLVNELNNTVIVYHYEESTHTAHVKQTISTLPSAAAGPSWCAAIILSSNGKNLYVSNRGHDSIAVFSVNDIGLLTLVEIVPVQGKCPRDIHIVGDWIVAANQVRDDRWLPCPT